MSRRLEAVLALAGDQPAILLGIVSEDDHAHILPSLPEGIGGQGEGHCSRADYLHQPGSNHQYGGSSDRAGTSSHRSASTSDDLAVTPDLVVQCDELPEWLCSFID